MNERGHGARYSLKSLQLFISETSEKYNNLEGNNWFALRFCQIMQYKRYF